MSLHWDINACTWKIHPLRFLLSLASKLPLLRAGIYMLLSFFSLVSLFKNYFRKLILIPLINLIALSMCALSPLSVQYMAQEEFSMGWHGCGPHGEHDRGSQRAAHFLSVQFEAMCTHGVHLICECEPAVLVREVSGGLLPPGLSLGFPMCLRALLQFLSCRRYGSVGELL